MRLRTMRAEKHDCGRRKFKLALSKGPATFRALSRLDVPQWVIARFASHEGDSRFQIDGATIATSGNRLGRARIVNRKPTIVNHSIFRCVISDALAEFGGQRLCNWPYLT